MEKRDVLDRIRREKLIPVVRADDTDDARKAIEILSECGIRVFEITLTIPNAVELIRELNDTDVLIGAGTVLNREQAEDCIEAGAKFIVSPAFNLETVQFCKENEIVVMPGSLTPTEVLATWNAGADCVKVFPCDVMGGAKYLKTLKTLFPHIEMMPTGGVSCETIAYFFAAGAIAVGVGADLVDIKAIRAGDSQSIAEKARKYLEIVHNLDID